MYTDTVKRKVLSQLKRGRAIATAAKMFKISPATVARWKLSLAAPTKTITKKKVAKKPLAQVKRLNTKKTAARATVSRRKAA